MLALTSNLRPVLNLVHSLTVIMPDCIVVATKCFTSGYGLDDVGQFCYMVTFECCVMVATGCLRASQCRTCSLNGYIDCVQSDVSASMCKETLDWMMCSEMTGNDRSAAWLPSSILCIGTCKGKHGHCALSSRSAFTTVARDCMWHEIWKMKRYISILAITAGSVKSDKQNVVCMAIAAMSCKICK